MPSVEVTFVRDAVPVERFWEVVDRTYRDVLNGQHPEHIDELQRRVAGRPSEEQLLFYHEEPLNVALDLASYDPDRPRNAAPEEIKRYLEIAREIGWRES